MINGRRTPVRLRHIIRVDEKSGLGLLFFCDSSLQGSRMTIDAYKDTAWTRSVENTVNNQNQPGDSDKAVKAVTTTLNARLEEIEKLAECSKKTDF